MGFDSTSGTALRALVRWAGAVAMAMLAAGCASMRSVDVPIDAPAKVLPDGTTGDLIKSGYDPDERNRWIEYHLVRIDTAYYQFERELQTQRTAVSTGAAIAGLFLDIASSLTPSAGVKANYAAASALSAGSLAIVNKETFLEQSVSTLVAAMRANRAKVYALIRAGMAKPVGQYLVSEAHRDILEYLRAGTLTEGMTFVVAKTKETSEADIAQARADIESVVALADIESKQAFCMSKSLEKLGPADRTRLLAVYRQVNPNPPDGMMKDIVDAFSRAYVNKPQAIRDYFAAMQRADLLLKPCPEDQ